MENGGICFFGGANTAEGFCGYLADSYEPSDDWQVYIIKAGAGTGKSTFMRRILQRVSEVYPQEESERLYCSSDPESLDGVRFPAARVAIFDGTAPHVLEPRYWGSCERIVDLGRCADASVWREQAAKMREYTDTCGSLHRRCCRFLRAAAAVREDSRLLASAFVDDDKIRRAAARIAAKELPARGQIWRETRRFVSAVTPQGVVTWYSTVWQLCPRLYAIEDEYGAVSAVFMPYMRRLIRQAGYAAVVGTCPLAPNEQVEHLLIPEIGVGFTVSAGWHKADFPVYRRLHAARFTDEESLRAHRNRLNFNRRMVRELVGEAVSASAEAKEWHDRLEACSVRAMDFAAADEMCERVCGEILQKMAARGGAPDKI